ncbi:MAG TPA: sigma-54 dependent transcriptional regulator [Terriglobia bacterium]|nr:sigma-54 dependent transcriptional regulator [Terriglobia bacterium]
MPDGSILVVDDEERQREIYRDILQDEGYAAEAAPSAEAALRLLAQRRFDLVITDLNLTGMTGVELLGEITHADPTVAVILVTGYPSVQSAIEATKKGVYTYLEKPLDRQKLLGVVGEVFEHLAALRQTIIGDSPATRDMLRMVLKVAPTAHTVLILGESGTGKELVAREIHKHSPRHDKPFLAVNCASLTETLLESELFGHEKGAFTDAHQQKKGLFERAHHSTLFLDEIGDTSLALQAKILRALQEREILRVGGTEPIKVDVRIIAATNRNLEQMLKEGRFREDLYYRLKVIPILCPPLRGRREDIAVLALHFCHKAALVSGRKIEGIAPDALAALEAYSWPGNIRQLEWAIERAVLLGETSRVEAGDLPPEVLERAPGLAQAAQAPMASGQGSGYSTSLPATDSPATSSRDGALDPVIPEGSWEEHEKAKIMEALQRTNGNITRAAQLLGMTFRTLQYRLEKFGIKRP